MAKRTATNDLNHDNWDQEDEPEESGTFTRASEDVMKTRVIKVAKRRNPIASSDSSKPSAFQGFTGFGSKTTTSSTPSGSFGFLSNLTNNKTENKTITTTPTKPPETTTTKLNGLGDADKDDDSKLNEYYAKLKGLNESVSSWIQKHVNLNPFINLQPIFKDYENYFNENEELKKKLMETNKKTNTDEKKTTPPAQFKFGIPSSQSTTTVSRTIATKPIFCFASSKTTSSGSNFTFGNLTSKTTTTTTTSTAQKLPSFGNLSSSSTLTFIPSPTSNPPSFSLSTPSTTPPSFTFNKSSLNSPLTTTTTSATTLTSSTTPSIKKDEVINVDGDDNPDEDQPPKVEFTRVVEDDSIYTIRCKVFVKKEKTFTDRGVGNLYLKSIKDNEKYQLIVRADTNLGNLLCNFILSKTIPIQRMGQKDVMLVCLPTPDTKPPPVPILLRVKTSDDADNLLETLKKYMK